MIDTNKYEGHTQGHWATTTRKGTWVVYTQDNGDVATMNDYEDAKLIAAAPLLLAEVKRLREENDMLSEAVIEDNDILRKHIETLAEVKRLRERLIRAYDWAENAVNGNDSAMMDYTEYVCGGEEE